MRPTAARIGGWVRTAFRCRACRERAYFNPVADRWKCFHCRVESGSRQTVTGFVWGIDR